MNRGAEPATQPVVAGALHLTRPADAVVRIEVANPPLNVLTQAVRRELGDAFVNLNAQRAVRCVIFGSGDKAFCAGADLAEFPLRFDPEVAGRHADNAYRMMLALVELDIPVVAALHGFCFGGGFELALGCSTRIAARSARLGLPEIDRGVWPGTGGILLLERLAGPSVAKRLVYSGQRLSADEALDLGLVDEVVDDDALDGRALEIAASYAAKPGASMRVISRLVDRRFRLAFRDHLQFERDRFVEAYQTDDAREGNRAFFEKRQPHWHHH